MRRRLLSLSVFVMLCVLCLFQGNAIGEEKSTADKQKQLYMDFLEAEGFKPETEDDLESVRFKHEGLIYHIFIDTGDPSFFQLVLHFNVDINDEAALVRFLKAADYSNKKSKLVKVYASDPTTIIFSAEAVFDNPEDFKIYFNRYLRLIQNGLKNYVAKWNE